MWPLRTGKKGDCLVLGNPRIDSGGRITGFGAARSVVEGSSVSGTEHRVLTCVFIKCKLVQPSRR